MIIHCIYNNNSYSTKDISLYTKKNPRYYAKLKKKTKDN